LILKSGLACRALAVLPLLLLSTRTVEQERGVRNTTQHDSAPSPGATTSATTRPPKRSRREAAVLNARAQARVPPVAINAVAVNVTVAAVGTFSRPVQRRHRRMQAQATATGQASVPCTASPLTWRAPPSVRRGPRPRRFSPRSLLNPSASFPLSPVSAPTVRFSLSVSSSHTRAHPTAEKLPTLSTLLFQLPPPRRRQ
jgi:hypothetical protein